MTPKEKVQQVANILGVDVWMAMEASGLWWLYDERPSVDRGHWYGSEENLLGICCLCDLDVRKHLDWKDSLVYATPEGD